jgi:purine-binding chemotaxis protein CheW
MQIVTFKAAGGIHALPILAVEELTRPVPVTPVPMADRRIAGLMNLRGRGGTVIDLARCFDRAPANEAGPRRMILLETADHLTEEARQLSVRVFREPVALLVGRILEIFPLQPGELRPRPAHVAERFVTGVFRRGDDYVSLIDPMILIEDILQPQGTS